MSGKETMHGRKRVHWIQMWWGGENAAEGAVGRKLGSGGEGTRRWNRACVLATHTQPYAHRRTKQKVATVRGRVVRTRDTAM